MINDVFCVIIASLETGRLVKWYNFGLQNRCREFDSLIARSNTKETRKRFLCLFDEAMRESKDGGREASNFTE